ncbi:glycosyltransferase family 4 protein [Ideonella sp. BN130291]|uniref:glycosyltransferase family 4 protein n=1 Tax=Ideonella sp. BN130291 TaxID=3112940 RepID=UPI002E2604AE|nr:glycosyltransferase family 1 protein [Ideonella sp. BN130291]
MNTVYINGKFTAQPTTGVQRAAHNTVAALDRLLQRQTAKSTHWVLLCPDRRRAPTLQCIETRVITGASMLGLHGWEQLLLPWVTKGAPLLSLSGSAPWLKHVQACTFYDAAVFDRPGAYRRVFVWWYRFLFRRLAGKAAFVATVSEFSKGRLMEHLPLTLQRVALLGCGADHFSAVTADGKVLMRLRLIPGHYFIVVGSANVNKNHSAVVEAFTKLADRPDLKLVIVGSHRPEVFSRAEVLGTDARIVHAGAVDDASLKALYEHAAALVFPSRYEGFGLPPLEAMSCGCPVITTRTAAIPESCGEAPFYVEEACAPQLAEAMHRLAGDPSLRVALAHAGRRHSARFTWDAVASRLLSSVSSVHWTDDTRQA